MTRAENVVSLHSALLARGIPYAFGETIAVAFWALDHRVDGVVEVHIFVPASDPERALAALPDDIVQPPGTIETIVRDGQIRLWWDDTPVDLFFDNAPVHEDAARHRKTVPFAGTQIPILGPVELTVFKAMFDRTRDWAGIEAMIAEGTVDLDAAERVLHTMLPPDDPRFARLAEACRRATDPG